MVALLGLVVVMVLAGCGSSSSPRCEPAAKPGPVVERRIVVERAGAGKLDALSLYLVRCEGGRTVALDPKNGTLFTSLDDFRHRNRLLGPKDQILVPKDLTSTVEKPEYVQVSGHVDDGTPGWVWPVVGAGSAVVVAVAVAVVLVVRRRRRAASPSTSDADMAPETAADEGEADEGEADEPAPSDPAPTDPPRAESTAESTFDPPAATTSGDQPAEQTERPA
ncbi:exported hypothetical protein [Frankia canadensis]|uniref:Uncharacterized protein n=1 Tax=Frankia canadensis TaxID=1836972 RepID=A0A2I2KP79_9ACTN|nr:hypothetical protein [Frankia canadensis]SNQ47475.1 exported hypothetical protein [Frankia canadensis]SOU54765.1 exported hypothetical protein [Frankia canadensis]